MNWGHVDKDHKIVVDYMFRTVDPKILEIRGINSTRLNSIDLHCHTFVSPCADREMALESIAQQAWVNGIDVITLTDHNAISPVIGNKETAPELQGTFGIELKTQYDEFNIIGATHEELERIIRESKTEGYKTFDHDKAMTAIDSINAENYAEKDHRILKVFNHPFSTPVKKPFGNKNQRKGFDFAGYLLDHWNGQDIVRFMDNTGGLINADYQMRKDMIKGDTKAEIEEKKEILARDILRKTNDLCERAMQYFKIREFVERYMLGDSMMNEANGFEMHENVMKGLMAQYDAVEMNAACYLLDDPKKALRLAEKYNKTVVFGGDSHELDMIGEKGFNIYPSNMTLTEAIDQGQIYPILSPTFTNPKEYRKTSINSRAVQGLRKKGLEKSRALTACAKLYVKTAVRAR